MSPTPSFVRHYGCNTPIWDVEDGYDFHFEFWTRCYTRNSEKAYQRIQFDQGEDRWLSTLLIQQVSQDFKSTHTKSLTYKKYFYAGGFHRQPLLNALLTLASTRQIVIV